MVAAISLPAELLKGELATVVLRPGSRVVARVLAAEAGRGVVSLAGLTLTAELPENVAAGDRLALRVSDDSSSDRVVLRLLDETPQQAALAMPVALPLPGGGDARLYVEDDGGQARDEESDAVSLVYDSPNLGNLGLRLTLGKSTVSATVSALPGEPHELALERAEALAQGLEKATQRAAKVTVTVRRQPLDTYA